METNICTLLEFAEDHQGWPRKATLRRQFWMWKHNEDGYTGNHFFKFHGVAMVDKKKYYKWVNSFNIKKEAENGKVF